MCEHWHLFMPYTCWCFLINRRYQIADSRATLVCGVLRSLYFWGKCLKSTPPNPLFFQHSHHAHIPNIPRKFRKFSLQAKCQAKCIKYHIKFWISIMRIFYFIRLMAASMCTHKVFFIMHAYQLYKHTQLMLQSSSDFVLFLMKRGEGKGLILVSRF